MKIIFILFFPVIGINGENSLFTNKNYDNLPPIFHLDPYTECVSKPQNAYCFINFQLSPNNASNPSEAWKLMESMKQHYAFYRHDLLNYGVCITNRDYVNDTNYLIQTYAPSNLSAIQVFPSVSDVYCEQLQPPINFGNFDIIFISIIIIWLYVMYSANKANQNELSVYLQPFSFKNIWFNLKKTWQTPDKSNVIQSMRFLTMVLIVCAHTYLSFSGGSLQNVKYMEEICQTPFKREFITIFFFLVSTFFLLSGWLLSYNSFRNFETNPNLTFWRFFSRTLLNRYCRLIPLAAFLISLITFSEVLKIHNGPLNYSMLSGMLRSCREKWWINLLFINNHYKFENMCSPMTWYLAADFQLYIASLIIVYLLSKVQNNTKYIIFAALILSSIFIQGLVIYSNNLDVAYRMCSKGGRLDAFSSNEILLLYLSTYSNIGSYIVGLLFGYLFYLKEKKTISNQTKNLLMSSFLILLPLTLFLASKQYSRILSALLGGLFKPMFAFSVACGMFAMLKGHGGPVKHIFEFKLFVFLGNICYSTYLIHILIVFKKTIASETLLQVSDNILIWSALEDLVTSFAAGFVVYFLIELPCSQLQTLFIPKLSHKKNK